MKEYSKFTTAILISYILHTKEDILEKVKKARKNGETSLVIPSETFIYFPEINVNAKHVSRFLKDYTVNEDNKLITINW